MISVLIRRGADTDMAQKSDHVRMQGRDGVYTTRTEATGGTSTAYTLISDFQPP